MANGFIVDWMDGLKDLLANAPVWQEVCGVSTATGAGERIHDELLIIDSATIERQGDQEQVSSLLPFAIISQGDDVWDKTEGGTRNYLILSGQVDLELCIAASDRADKTEQMREFRTQVGQIIEWMAENCGNGDYANFTRIEQIVKPMRIVRDEPKVGGQGKSGWHWFYAWYGFVFGEG